MSDGRDRSGNSWWKKLFPRMPDFEGMLNSQCELVVETTTELHLYMTTSDRAHAERVLELERACEDLKYSNMTQLHHAFATPFDREDIYRSIAAIDEIVNYARTTVKEMWGLQLEPDEHMAAMARLLREGSVSLRNGYARLHNNPLRAEAHADGAKETEHETELVYRKALSELFDAEHYMTTLTPEQQRAESSLEVLAQEISHRETSAIGSAVGFVVEILKRREVYRHMSNAADRVARAGDVLHDIVAKIA